MTDPVDNLTARLAAAEQRAKAAEAERDDWKLSSDFEHADVDQLKQQLADRDATIRTQQREIVALEAEIEEWDERYTGEGRARFECAAHVERLQAQVATLEAEVADLTRARRLAEYDRLRQRP